MLVGFGAAMIAGFLSFLSPCVLPLVPGYIGFLGGVNQSGERAKSRAGLILASVAFVGGFITVFLALGISSSMAGSFVVRYMAVLQIVAGVIIVGLGVHFLDLISIGVLNRDIRFMPSPKRRGSIGAYIVGLAFGFGWTPCVGPVLATILMIAAGSGEASHGFSLLLAYGFGLGAPFVIVAAFADLFMAKFQHFSRSMKYVKWGLGGLLIVTGLLIMTGQFSEVGFWLFRNVSLFQQVG